jgi:hypothetical protein
VAKLAEWCTCTKEIVGGWELTILNAEPAKINDGVKLLAAAVPLHYVSTDRVADLLKRLGKAKAATFIETHLPTTKAVRSGDLGEILGVTYVREFTLFKLGINRLRWKDHRNMALRGEDVLSFAIDAKTNKLSILKGEAKSRLSLNTATVTAARKALAANNGRPSAHAMAFIATRYLELGDKKMTDLLDRAQLGQQVSVSQVTHMMFTFSGNDATTILRNDLNAYKGKIEQISVGIRVPKHQEFIKSVFEQVSIDGL